MARSFDAIIVGAGHNGLVCGAYLAKAGLKVCVLERRHVIGGAATTEELWPGYRFSTASYIMGLLQPKREGPGGRNRVYSARDRTRLTLTLRAKRLGLSLTEAKDIIDMYDGARDTGPQLRKFLAILAEHRRQLEEQMADLVANLDEVKVHEKEARALLNKVERKGA